MAWKYEQSTGELLRDGERVGTGYSGHGTGINNQALQGLRNVGPIPLGLYDIGDAFKHKSKGEITMRLTPIDHDAQGRSGFLIHGDNKLLNRTGSHGCIVLSRSIRELIAASEETELEVV